jgi:hypothetical protein
MTIQELLTDETAWTKNAYARLPTGEPCSSTNPGAASWCLLGAVNRCYTDTARSERQNESARGEIERRLRAAIQRMVLAKADGTIKHEDTPYLHSWNDDKRRTFAEVRRIIEAANV